MMELFGDEDLKEELAEMERERVGLMEALARVAVRQKALQKQMRAVEKRHREIAKRMDEHHVPEDRELTQEDVERWCQSAYFNMAHTAPQNPHAYYARKKIKEPSMYQRVVAFILEHGHIQRYRGAEYTVLDVELNGTRWFLWPMTDKPEESQVLNLKPVSMKPEEEERT